MEGIYNIILKNDWDRFSEILSIKQDDKYNIIIINNSTYYFYDSRELCDNDFKIINELFVLLE